MGLLQVNSREECSGTCTNKQAKERERKPWLTPDIRKLIKRKDRAHRAMRRSGHDKDRTKFRQLKGTVQREMRRAYWKYIEGIVSHEEVVTNRTYVKHMRSHSNTIAGLKEGRRLFTQDTDNRQFQSAFSAGSIFSDAEF